VSLVDLGGNPFELAIAANWNNDALCLGRGRVFDRAGAECQLGHGKSFTVGQGCSV